MKKFMILLLIFALALGSAGVASAASISMDPGSSSDPLNSVLNRIAPLNALTALQLITKQKDDTSSAPTGSPVPLVHGDVITITTNLLSDVGWANLDAAIKMAGVRVGINLMNTPAPTGANASISTALRGNPFVAAIVLHSETTAIAANAFAGCTGLEVVAIDDSSDIKLANIGDGAFAGCTNLKEFGPLSNVGKPTSTGSWAGLPVPMDTTSATPAVFIPNTVTTISPNAFAGCTSIRALILMPADGSPLALVATTTIGASAFENCTALRSLNLNNAVPAATVIGLTTIGNRAFAGCTNLEAALTLPNAKNTAATPVDIYTVTSIGDNAFSGTKIINITGTNSLLTIGAGAFENCTTLVGGTNSGLPTGVSGAHLYFPAVETIGDGAFAGCTGLVRVSLANQAVVGTNAFNGASNLTSVYFKATTSMLLPTTPEGFLVEINERRAGNNAFLGTKLGASGGTLSVMLDPGQAQRSLWNLVDGYVEDLSATNSGIRRTVNYLAKVGLTVAEIETLSAIPASVAQAIIGTPSTSVPSVTSLPPATGTPGATSQPRGGDSSSGCDVGIGIFALALAGAVVLRKRVF